MFRKQWLALPIVLVLAGCVRQSSLNPHGPAAREIGNLEGWILGVFCLVTVVMWVLIVIAVLSRRGSLEEHAPVDTGGGQKWIVIGGFAIPVLILAGVFMSGVDVLADFPMHDGAMLMPAQIRLVGHQWWWEIYYLEGPLQHHFITANEIHIPAGQPVDIDLASYDVIHSFWVPELHGKVDLVPGVRNRIRIQADRPGTYRGQCAEYCGEEHARMILLVVAQTSEDYGRWVTNQLQDAAVPANAQQSEGQELFQQRACSLCHTIRGTLAQGRVGPDLTHLASRQKIAANLLDNDTANLAAWAVHAQALKPGVLMPNLSEFDGEQLRALVAYLQNLR
jgi:cytochrome c oxidase subunit II